MAVNIQCICLITSSYVYTSGYAITDSCNLPLRCAKLS